jgi:hypothetical protein
LGQMKPNAIRFRVDPGDVPPDKAARRMHLTLAEFEARKEQLFARGFPRPDATTGMYDLTEIDRWRSQRHLTKEPTARNASEGFVERLAGLGRR